jgi:hypothetical protein
MIIKFDKPVYETTWTGNVDRILSYDTDRMKFTVQDVKTGKIREHMTNIDAVYVSNRYEPYSNHNRKEVIKYMIECGLPTRTIDRLLYI